MHTPLTMLVQLPPGCGAWTVGEKELSPPGVSAFSVGDTIDEVVDDGVVVVEGSSLVLLQPDRVPMTTSAVAPPANAIRLITRPLLIVTSVVRRCSHAQE